MKVNKGRFCPAQFDVDSVDEVIGVGTYECTCCSFYNGNDGDQINCLWRGRDKEEKAKAKEKRAHIHNCWFCDSPDIEVRRFENEWNVVCLKCGAYSPDGFNRSTAINLWNNPKGLLL